VDVTLRHLRTFVVLAEELHFRRAAERLNFSQSALSHQVRQLEDALGARLLDRDRRRVALTAAGEVLLREAHRLLASADQLVASVRSVAAAVAPVRVCYSPSAHRLFVADLIHELERSCPELDVVWTERSDEIDAADLLRARYDLVLGRYPPQAEGLESDELLRERPAVYVSASDPLASLDAVPVVALRGRRIRTVRREIAPQHLDATLADLARAGVGEVESTLSTGNWGSAEMLEEIAAGEYVAIGLASSRSRYTTVAVVALGAEATPVPLTLTGRSDEPRAEVRAFAEAARRAAATARGGDWLV
jgi:DNA-binding transcriptional LysR family regulator